MTSEEKQDVQSGIVLGQKYAYATASLVIGIVCFINLLGLERAILAVVFGWLALRSKPTPRLDNRRLWAKIGLVMGIIMLITIPTILIVFFDHFRELITTLEKLQ